MKKEKIACLYEINLFNECDERVGIYVGITKDFVKRKNSHINLSKKERGERYPVYRAMKKYKYSFNIIYKQDVYNRDELNALEIEYIKKYRESKDLNCYNITDGGDGLSGYGVKVVQYSINGEMKNKFNTANEAGEFIGVSSSNITMACNGILKIVKGYVWRYEYDAFNKYEVEYKYFKKPVYQYSIHGELLNKYESVRCASKALNINESNIQASCTGVQKKSGGFVWRYEGDSFDKYDVKTTFNVYPVYVSDLHGNHIATYSSCADAGRSLGLDISRIAKCCKGLCSHIKGYTFKYLKD